MLKICFRADLEFLRLGEVAQRFGIRFRPLFEIVLQLVVFAPKLLFKEGMKNHGRSAGVLHSFDVIAILRKR